MVSCRRQGDPLPLGLLKQKDGSLGNKRTAGRAWGGDGKLLLCKANVFFRRYDKRAIEPIRVFLKQLSTAAILEATRSSFNRRNIMP